MQTKEQDGETGPVLLAGTDIPGTGNVTGCARGDDVADTSMRRIV